MMRYILSGAGGYHTKGKFCRIDKNFGRRYQILSLTVIKIIFLSTFQLLRLREYRDFSLSSEGEEITPMEIFKFYIIATVSGDAGLEEYKHSWIYEVKPDYYWAVVIVQ